MTPTVGDKATIREVAAHAEVSIATVSRVLRGNAPVAEATRRRVLDSVEHLGFRPSVLGRSLAEGRHAAGGIVFPDLSGPYYAEVVLGYEEVAGERGQSVLIVSTRGRADADDVVRSLAARVDGMVLLGRTVGDEVVLEVTDRGLPVVLIARPAPPGVDSVAAESLHSASRLTEHLLGHGCRRFVFVGDAVRSPDTAQRWAGFCHALWEHDIEPPAGPVPAGLTEEDGLRLAAEILDETPRRLPDAFVCANDELALGLLTGLSRRGVAVPADVAVTGWDDIMAARHRGLTTVRQPMRALGGTAARLLEDRLAEPLAPVRHEVLPTDLVLRTSCGCPDERGQYLP